MTPDDAPAPPRPESPRGPPVERSVERPAPDPQKRRRWSRSTLKFYVDLSLKLLVTGVLGWATFVYQKDLATDNMDASVMRDFGALYAESPKLAVRYIASINQEEHRDRLYHYVIWDTLERNMSEEPCRLRNHESPDWHLIGDVAYELDNHSDSFKKWWKEDLTRFSLERRWPTHCDDLKAMFEWVRQTYELAVPKIAVECRVSPVVPSCSQAQVTSRSPLRSNQAAPSATPTSGPMPASSAPMPVSSAPLQAPDP